MQHKHLQFHRGFRVVLCDVQSQAAQMTHAPGTTEGGPAYWHKGADQWLNVLSGKGVAIVEGERLGLPHEKRARS